MKQKQLTPMLASATFYSGSALYSFATNLFFTAVPFFLIHFGSSGTAVSLSMMIYFSAYVTGCLLPTGKIPANRLLLVPVMGGLLSAVGALALIITLKYPDSSAGTAAVLTVCGTNGFLQSFFWPVMMTRSGQGVQGKELARRLGRFNLSWSIPFFLIPFIGGEMLEIGYLLTARFILGFYLACSLTLLVSFISDLTSLRRSGQDSREEEKAQPAVEAQTIAVEPRNRLMLRLSRIALFFSCLIFISLKTNLPYFMDQKLAMSESDFGLVHSVTNFIIVLLFTIMPKLSRWHYHRRTLLIFNALMVPATLTLALLTPLLVLQPSQSLLLTLIILSAVLAGISYAYSYVSHQFYNLQHPGTGRLSASTHEIILSAGFITGSLAGGILEKVGSSAVVFLFFLAIALPAALIPLMFRPQKS